MHTSNIQDQGMQELNELQGILSQNVGEMFKKDTVPLAEDKATAELQNVSKKNFFRTMIEVLGNIMPNFFIFFRNLITYGLPATTYNAW
eukprot:CAMPEP_0116943282 /NCGR_PEP_ID=MMETSP0467-20121206/35102_1 /TAXON_ID=283647 /ORGANISM="Mesodinium pulex, Strain SPMC105" /LENGTH=88 /DNA_ID=CAMNT_0004626449 /DNA_START=1473 /DNA_END=1736 /DNA_ORIENTATION=-